MIVLNLFIGLLALLLSLGANSIQSTQANSRDTTRKSEINAIYAKLEEHYNEYAEYPLVDEVLYKYDLKMPGLDKDTLIDPNGKLINQGDYEYTPTDCTAIGCGHFTLSSVLEDGTTYTKHSLN